MSAQRDRMKRDLIDELVGYIHEKLPEDQTAGAEAFARQYYDGVPAGDLVDRSVLDLYGAAVALWNFAAIRRPGETKVRVYSPRLEYHGWRSTHTIAEIVADDMPFLVDSVMMELNRHGLMIHLIVHPSVRVRRDANDRLVEVLDPDTPGDQGLVESFIHVEVDRQTDPAVLEALRADIEHVLADVRATVEDWPAMRARCREIVEAYSEQPPPVDRDELAEALEFLRWIDDKHFTFLGYRAYDLVEQDSAVALRSVPGTGLGILRQSQQSVSESFAVLPPEAQRQAKDPHILVLTKANSRATVHRPSYLDYVGVKRFDEHGKVIGEWRFLGLYTSVVYNSSPRYLPVLRRRVQAIIDRAGFPPASHNEKALLDILETYPRDELFQITEDELFQIAMGILALKERQRVKLFVRRDTYGRFLSCLVYIPRDRYNTEVRHRVERILTSAFDGTLADFSARVSESVLARWHFIIQTDPKKLADYDLAEVEARLVQATRSWRDDLHVTLLENRGEEEGNALFAKYADAFPAAYREDFPARNAVYDIARLEDLAPDGTPAMSLYHPLEAAPGLLRFKLLWAERAPVLSDLVPLLEHMGLKVLDERPYGIHPSVGPPLWIIDFGLAPTGEDRGELEAANVKEIFQDAFARVWQGDADSDGFNRLVLRARLTWREIAVLRAYCKYLRQAGITFSQAYMEQVLAANADVATLLVRLFHARFDPQRTSRETEVSRLVAELEAALDAVANLDEDRILRGFRDVMLATVRTNYYQTTADGEHKPYLSFKFDPSRIPLLPQPRPLFEIFVYSPRVEAVHLRGARVARGGIRWSDRPEDFRTEILGLMKAQMVKNAVIVPQGAKGGFVVKRPPAGRDRDALAAEVRACYSTFMHGLLDLTDNYVDGRPAPPPEVVCHDDPDPYLVVAADKGTATFSDLANSIADEYGFWLGDAFASGGSTGYDHKKMGITARGAWESVRRHFRELGVDTQTQDFTVVGIGDMSGDVFGNGMLLSEHIKLVGAFNHLHVFLDPDPDPAASFRERQRLFELPRSSWDDYDRSLLSAGGGIWPRTAKSVRLSGEAKRALGVQAETMTPNELIRALLAAPVDLLWNGGIGTYVKSTRETAAQVGDRTNDAVRVDAAELRCRVVGEGGNLGLTQLGRIEYALGGGRINTDFIDNSGGVDCSDHEVNIKILLDEAVAAGDLTRKQRNELLADMTDEVARLVLHDNYHQAQAISATEALAPQLLDGHARLMRRLERERKLNRKLECLPDDKTITERHTQGKGLTRPELAVLLAYSKNTALAALLDSGVPEDPYLSAELERYFPAPLRERFGAEMQRHRLRREIIATAIANGMINRVGSTFVNWLREETGSDVPEVARAYTVAREIFDLLTTWGEIESLDDRVHAHVQNAMVIETRKLVERSALWLLRNRRQPMDVADEVRTFAPGAANLFEQLPKLLVGADLEELERRTGHLTAQNVPSELAARIAALEPMSAALDIIEVARGSDRDVDEVGAVYFTLGARLDLDWLRGQIVALPVESHWDNLAKASLRDDLFMQHRGLAASVLAAGGDGGGPEELVDAWLDDNQVRVRRCLDTFADLRSAGTATIAMLSVGLRELRNLVQAGGPAARERAAAPG